MRVFSLIQVDISNLMVLSGKEKLQDSVLLTWYPMTIQSSNSGIWITLHQDKFFTDLIALKRSSVAFGSPDCFVISHKVNRAAGRRSSCHGFCNSTKTFYHNQKPHNHLTGLGTVKSIYHCPKIISFTFSFLFYSFFLV